MKFATLSNILAQPVDQDIPFDAYNKKVNLKLVICPFCSLSLCSPAELNCHRRAVHFRQRAPGSFVMQFEEINTSDEVREIIDEKEGEYLCIMVDAEDVEWKRLGPTHPLIKKYRAERKRLMQGVNDGPNEISESKLEDFLSSPWEDI